MCPGVVAPAQLLPHLIRLFLELIIASLQPLQVLLQLINLLHVLLKLVLQPFHLRAEFLVRRPLLLELAFEPLELHPLPLDLRLPALQLRLLLVDLSLLPCGQLLELSVSGPQGGFPLLEFSQRRLGLNELAPCGVQLQLQLLGALLCRLHPHAGGTQLLATLLQLSVRLLEFLLTGPIPLPGLGLGMPQQRLYQGLRRPPTAQLSDLVIDDGHHELLCILVQVAHRLVEGDGIILEVTAGMTASSQRSHLLHGRQVALRELLPQLLHLCTGSGHWALLLQDSVNFA
mmetsp:Transcript_118395/g.330233  ORF Transcript_118395/g.330233 Transcript_118395/m.330233 type:complete len:287 (+) Transcript_118395:292-1152(+)